MPSDAHQEAQGVVSHSVGSSLEVYAVGAEHARLLKALGTGKPLCLDLSQVHSCDVAGVQLLVSVAKSAAQGRRISLKCPVPECVNSSALAVGLSSDFLKGIPLHSPDKP